MTGAALGQGFIWSCTGCWGGIWDCWQLTWPALGPKLNKASLAAALGVCIGVWAALVIWLGSALSPKLNRAPLGPPLGFGVRPTTTGRLASYWAPHADLGLHWVLVWLPRLLRDWHLTRHHSRCKTQQGFTWSSTWCQGGSHDSRPGLW